MASRKAPAAAQAGQAPRDGLKFAFTMDHYARLLCESAGGRIPDPSGSLTRRRRYPRYLTMQRPESSAGAAALDLWPLSGPEAAGSEACRLLLEEASRLPALQGRRPRLVLSPAAGGGAAPGALDSVRALAAPLWPGLEPVWQEVAPGPRELARLAADGVPVLLLQAREDGPWEGMLLAGPAPAAPEPAQGELACDGVRYADLTHGGGIWHAGSVLPAWRQELLALGAQPDAAALEAMGQRGIWLRPQGEVPPLAVMCCGQGAVWPGMGRELYDHFPAARAAMDRIARVADWDVLALLDETDVEKIGLTRWQQPYLFLLEYAQWSHLASLGLRPSLICGHSLGELIALCLAGVYEPEVAWYILDTRSTHMAELEARATRETGMMAVPAEASVIEEARRTWPQLYVSNYNSPRQFIISGPRDVLLEARKSLRKRRIPAIMLNVSLAFHHPSMRVLRDMSLRRLNALAMRAARIPMLSCITTRPYPDDQPGICEHIGDLDENSVRWVECVQAMWQRDGIRHFVEMGPQDTLCGLVGDIEPRALCLAAGRKGREAEGMRQTCAQLYALGHLTHAGVARHRQRWLDATPSAAPVAAGAPVSPASAAPAPGREELPEAARKVLAILAAACGREADALRPEMDLRYDLALRSSRFPLIVQEVEESLGITVDFEALLHVATVGDLLRVLARLSASDTAEAAEQGEGPLAAPHHGRGQDLPPLCCFDLGCCDGDGRPLPLALDPAARGMEAREGDVLAVWGPEAQRLPLAELLGSLAPLGMTFALPGAALDACLPLEALGGHLYGLPGLTALTTLPETLRRACGRLDGLLLCAPADRDLPAEDMAQLCRVAVACGVRYVYALRWLAPGGEARPAPWQEAGEAAARELGLPWRVVCVDDGGRPAIPRELGDLLARALTHGTADRVLWRRAPAQAAARGWQWLERPELFPRVFSAAVAHEAMPWPEAGQPSSRQMLACAQFSRYATPRLSGHGALPPEGLPWLPVSELLQTMLESGCLQLPWLAATGFSDLRFAAPLYLPQGVTRECRITSRVRSWLAQDGVMTRMCHVRLQSRDLAPNLRRINRFSPLAQGMVFLAAAAGALPSLWSDDLTASGPELPLEDFYAACGMSADWRLLRRLLPAGGDMWQGEFRAAAESIAPAGKSGYDVLLSAVDAILQAACRIMEETVSGGAAAGARLCWPRDWRLSGIGFIRFADAGVRDAARTPWRVQLRRGWDDERLQRYDAQVVDAGGQILLTLHQMEFEKDARPVEAAGA